MNDSQVTVQAGAGHQQGSPAHTEGVHRVPKGFHLPTLPDQVIQNSRWDEDQEGDIHDGEVQYEEFVWREASSVPVLLKHLPQDDNGHRKTQSKAHEGRTGPRIFAPRKSVTHIKVKLFPLESRCGRVAGMKIYLQQHFGAHLKDTDTFTFHITNVKNRLQNLL